MRTKIDISDTFIEKSEALHRLHVWGPITSRWDDTCVECAQDVDVAGEGIRCECGEGFFCSADCRDRAPDWSTYRCDACKKTSLESRPSRKHRRAALLLPDPAGLELFWVKVKGAKLLIDHPGLEMYYKHVGTDKCWVDLAVINPALEGRAPPIYLNLGHGIAVGFPSNMMSSESKVDARWANKSTMTGNAPGYGAQWPGPVLFFAYSYDVHDYVKVNPASSCSVEHGAEATMSPDDIWDELDKLRRHYKKPETPEESSKGTKGEKNDTAGVWKWKVRDRGTSMKVLDVSRRDTTAIGYYMLCSWLNPLPANSVCAASISACKAIDPCHPGYSHQSLWGVCAQEPLGSGETASLYQPIFAQVTLPGKPAPLLPLAGAILVGIRWCVHYSMDINPPFRHHIHGACHSHARLLSLLWGLDLKTGTGPPLVELCRPGETCDSAIILHADGVTIDHRHVKALWKYLNFTEPGKWSRHGPKGFEAYWQTCARIEFQGFNTSPYDHADHVKAASRTPPGSRRHLPDIMETVEAHMTLGDLGVDESRRDEVVARRDLILKAIGAYRQRKWRLSIGAGTDGK